jgi:2,3-dihydroxybenzoate-AMP ligase
MTPRTPVTIAGVVPWPAADAARYRAAGYWQDRSIGSYIGAQVRERPEVDAVVDGPVRLTYRQLWERAGAAAQTLLDAGLRAGDRIVLQLPNCWEFVALTLGCLRIGVIPVMALPAHRRHELTHLAALSEAVALVVVDVDRGTDLRPVAQQIAAEVPSVRAVFVHGELSPTAAGAAGDTACAADGGGAMPGGVGGDADAAPGGAAAGVVSGPGNAAPGAAELGRRGPDDGAAEALTSGTGIAAVEVDSAGARVPEYRLADIFTGAVRFDEAGHDPAGGDVALLLLSGGTTGLPKLIVRTHDDYVYNVLCCNEIAGFDADTVYLGALPASHNFPLACPGVLGALFAGGRAVMLPSPAPERALSTIDAEGVTAAAVVPAVAQSWIEYQREHATMRGRSLRVLQVGGSRMPDELAVRVEPVLGARLQQVFGMAEGLINMTRLDDAPEIVHTTQGRPVSAADEILVVDEHGDPVPDGTPGALLTRGPYTPRGYFRAPEHNARAFTPDGWYGSGDVVVRRPDGNLVVAGRDKDMINRGGEKISAEEVENFAYQVDGVEMAAAVAMPDEVLGERLCLYVTMAPGRAIALDDVVAVMNGAGVARFKLPERLVLVEGMPITKVGKIDKKALREDISARLRSDR